MACWHPYRVNLLCYKGGKTVEFSPSTWYDGEIRKGNFWYTTKTGKNVYCNEIRSILLPCGKCEGCKIEHARQWSYRCWNESLKYEKNCFVTLTYNDDFLPDDNSLHKDHLQKFIKRLRKRIYPDKVKYFACGEYGSKGRPHYHLILFGYSFDDLQFKIENGRSFTCSNVLNQLWPFGFTSVSALTPGRCDYVARYCVKKLTKEDLDGRVPEFTLMSTRPAICLDLFQDYGDRIVQNGFVLKQGKKCKIPRYCDKVVEKKNKKLMDHVKDIRMKNVKPYSPDDIKRKIEYTKYLQSLHTDKKI